MALLFFLWSSFALAKPVTPAWPVAAVVVAADGTRLEASIGVPARSKRGVLFLHQNGRNREDWSALAEALLRDGNIVLSFDLRGHGANRPTPPADLRPEDYQAMQGDVAAAVVLLRSMGAERICIIGAEVGANLAINAAVAEASVASIVLLSPGADLKGIIAIDAVQRFAPRPLLIVASEDDVAGARAAAVLDSKAQGAHELRILEKAGRGVQMLMRSPALQGDLVGWVGSNWLAE